jgi:hypothetical protein
MARRGVLTQTAEPAKEVLSVETIDVMADRGYFKIENIDTSEKAGIEPYVPRPQRGPSVKAGLFSKDESSGVGARLKCHRACKVEMTPQAAATSSSVTAGRGSGKRAVVRPPLLFQQSQCKAL